MKDKYLCVKAFPLNHKIECFGFRFDTDKVSYAYCSDTAPFPQLAEWVKGATVMYHEATYTSQFADKAAEYYHSTAVDAARCALEAGVGKLLIGHYSSRIRDIALFERESREIFLNSIAANDGDVYEITDKPSVPASAD